MKVVGIVAEFNPFHNGHKYLIDKAKQLTSAQFVVAVMSGNFTQNGNIALHDKFKRAEVAIKNGVDIVIELPLIYSISSSEYFAKGAMKILNNLGIIDAICFGSESGDITQIKNIAKTLLINEEKIKEDIKLNLNDGISYAKAVNIANSKYLSAANLEELKKPNNILAIEYVKNILKNNYNIIPYTIKREGANYCDKSINKDCKYISASSIREFISNININDDNIDTLQDFIPKETFNLISNNISLDNNYLFNILKYSILTKKNLSDINGIVEGLENNIIKALNNSTNYDELIHNIKSKRYTMSKIKRVLLNILLNITKNDFNLIENNINYAHILKISNNGKKLLSQIYNNSNINIITKITDNILNNLDEITRRSLKFDILATNIHSSLSNEAQNKDYTNKL